MEKSSFIYYFDWAQELLKLPDDLRLRIDDAVKRYVLYAEEPTDREVLYSMFGLIRNRIDEDKVKWQEKCNKNHDNIQKRWREKNTNVYERIQTNTNDTDSDSDKDKDKEYKEISTNVDTKKDGLSLNLSKRKNNFKESLKPFVEIFGADMMNDFFSYWTEPNKSNTKMRYELEKTWDIKRRLSRWANNNIKNQVYESNSKVR